MSLALGLTPAGLGLIFGDLTFKHLWTKETDLSNWVEIIGILLFVISLCILDMYPEKKRKLSLSKINVIPFTIDHVYICLSAAEFQVLKENSSNNGGVYEEYLPVDGSSGWEGVYFYSQEGTYFEVRLAKGNLKPGQIGIGLSSRDPDIDTIEFCKARFKDIKHQEYYDNFGQFWFTSIFKQNLPESLGANVWIMNYTGEYPAKRFDGNYGKPKLKNINHIKLFTTQEYIDQLKSNFSDWLPNQKLISFHAVTNDQEIRYELTSK